MLAFDIGLYNVTNRAERALSYMRQPRIWSDPYYLVVEPS